MPLTINMLVAYLAADRDALFSVISDPDRFYGADPFTFLMASLVVLAFGPGRFALDAWIGRKGSSRPSEVDSSRHVRHRKANAGFKPV